MLPPSVSLAVHGLLLAALLIVGINAAIPEEPDTRPLGEIEGDGPVALLARQPVREPVREPERSEPGTGAPAPVREATGADAPVAARRAEAPARGLAGRGAPEAARSGRSGATGSGALAAAGPSSGGAASFAGLRARAASRIVYVVDASGAMASSLSYVIEELERSIERLSPTQHFQVVLFRDPPGRSGEAPAAVVLPSPGEGPSLLRATPSNRALAVRHARSVRPEGRSDPLDGLEVALAMEPDLIFLLGRGIHRSGQNASWGRGREAILEALDRLNPLDGRAGRRPTVIKTIQFLDEDPTGLMPAIGQLHGDGEGSYRTLTFEELGAVAADPAEPAIGGGEPARGDGSVSESGSLLASVERDGSGLAVLYGIPLSHHGVPVRQSARAALDLLRREDDNGDDPRRALLRARAAVYLAALAPTERERHLLADGAVEDASAASAHEASAEAMRVLTLALAKSLADDAEGARRTIRGLLDDLDALSPAPEVRAEAHLVAVRLARGEAEVREAAQALRRAARRAPFVRDGDPDPLWTLLAAEAEVRALLREPGLRASAFGPLLGLLEREGLFEDEDARRSVVGSRLAAAADRGGFADGELPTTVLFARALDVARDDANRAEALRLLGLVLAREDAAGIEADVRWEEAVVTRLAQTVAAHEAAADLLVALMRDHPRSARAMEAAELLAWDAMENDPELPDALRARMLADAIGFVPEHPEASVWAIERARLLPERERLAALESIDPASEAGAEALALHAEAVDRMARGAGDASRAALLERRLAMVERHGAGGASALRVELAELLVRGEAPDPGRAAALLGDMTGSGSPGGSAGAALLLAEAQRMLGDEAAAFGLLRELAPALTGEDAWRCWTMMLEILSGRGESGAVRAHLARLRHEDPELGGSPWRERLERLAR